MVNIKPAKEINAQKWRRMKLILEKLREKPLPSKEICRIVFSSSAIDRTKLRTIQNYLAELIGLDLINYDPFSGVYSSNENKIVFKSKHDYDLALNHSKRLVHLTRDTQPHDYVSPSETLRTLAFWEDNVTNHDAEDTRFLQHLKTGYYEIFQLMEEYRQKIKKLGLSPKYDVPHLGFNPNRPTEISQSDLRELENMKAQLIGQIINLIDRVKHGCPLEGSCDACPAKYLSIKSA